MSSVKIEPNPTCASRCSRSVGPRARPLRSSPKREPDVKRAALEAAAKELRASAKTVLRANADDVADAKSARAVERDDRSARAEREAGRGDRGGLEVVAALEDPVGQTIADGSARTGSRSRACACRSA